MTQNFSWQENKDKANNRHSRPAGEAKTQPERVARQLGDGQEEQQS